MFSLIPTERLPCFTLFSEVYALVRTSVELANPWYGKKLQRPACIVFVRLPGWDLRDPPPPEAIVKDSGWHGWVLQSVTFPNSEIFPLPYGYSTYYFFAVSLYSSYLFHFWIVGTVRWQPKSKHVGARFIVVKKWKWNWINHELVSNAHQSRFAFDRLPKTQTQVQIRYFCHMINVNYNIRRGMNPTICIPIT